MATNQTEHYQLNQWELSDSVVMADFNADNAKIEQALLDLKASLPKFQSGSYVGTGAYGSTNPTTLTFDFDPQVVFLAQEVECVNGMAPTPCLRGLSSMVVAHNPQGQHEYHPERLYMSWDGPTFSCYAGNAGLQYNQAGQTYHYLAIG